MSGAIPAGLSVSMTTLEQRACLPASVVGFFDGAVQPHLDQSLPGLLSAVKFPNKINFYRLLQDTLRAFTIFLSCKKGAQSGIVRQH